MNKIILTDADGVILDWEAGFHNWMVAKGYDRVHSDSYDLSTHYADMTPEYAQDRVKEFNGSSWLLGLDAFRDARSGIAKLAENGYEFHVITAIGHDVHAQECRQQNLDALFGTTAITKLTCSSASESKVPELSEYKNTNAYWIEDRFSNAVDGADLGLRSLLMDHPHNKLDVDNRIKRVNSWSDICSIILNEAA
jgi:FMN phosphatase YigB (HAD superfamily)